MATADPEAPETTPTAAVLLIGNELLSGKIRDENGHHLARVLRRRGIALLEIVTVADVLDDIGDALLRLLRRTPLVFTSGGVGPTHDDVTIEAIARATRRPVSRDPAMEALLRQHYGDRITPAALKMADLPQGTCLRAESGWPVLRLDVGAGSLPDVHGGDEGPPHDARIYILPGIPALLRAKVDALEQLEDELPMTEGWILLTVQTSLDESALAGPLAEIAAAHPEVEIGSYPRWTPDEEGRLRAHVRITLEASGPHASDAEHARRALLERLDPSTLLADPRESERKPAF
jgi:molybdenum cofactor synthesis domain-containing protein